MLHSLKLHMLYFRLARSDNNDKTLCNGKMRLPQSNSVTKTNLPAVKVICLITT